MMVISGWQNSWWFLFLFICIHLFTYVFPKLSTNSMGAVIFQWLLWSTVRKKKKNKGEVMSMKEKLSEKHCYVKDKPTGLGLGPLRNFIFLAVHSFSDSLFSYIFIKIQRRPKWRRFRSCPQAASSYLQTVHHKGRGEELDKSCILRINCKKN